MNLSNNAIQTFFACQAKFKHRYILKTCIDEDYVLDDENLKYGSLVHELAQTISLLVYNMSPEILCTEDIKKIIKDKIRNNPDYERFSSIDYIPKLIIHCLCIKDIYKNKIGNIKKLQTEFELPNRSRIDAIIETKFKRVIVDYKTVSRFDDNKLSNIHNNFQLNYYAHALENIPTHLCHIDLLKPLQKVTNKDKSVDDFLARILASKEHISDFYRVILVPYHKQYNDYIDVLLDEINNRKMFICNFNNCYNQYGQVCEYFSQCNGNKATTKVGVIL